MQHASKRLGQQGQLYFVALAAPSFLLLLLFFIIPLARLLMLSVEGGSSAYFSRALFEGLYVEVMARTFGVAAAVTFLTLLLGYPVAYFLAKASPFWRMVGFFVVLLPLWTSVLVRTYAWMALLGRNGVINQALLAVGMTDQPIPLLYNVFGVLVGMTHVLLPYMVLPLYSAIHNVDQNLVPAAEGLGASRLAIFTRILLPLTRHGVGAGATLVFIFSLGFYITPAILGGGKVAMISTVIQQQVSEVLNWNFAAALSTVLLAATIAIYALGHFLFLRNPAEQR